MLDPQDLVKVASTFAVAEEQVRRDHLIGHALAALESLHLPKLVLFGGTALTWTLLPTGRLSEEIPFIGPRAGRSHLTTSLALLRTTGWRRCSTRPMHFLRR